MGAVARRRSRLFPCCRGVEDGGRPKAATFLCLPDALIHKWGNPFFSHCPLSPTHHPQPVTRRLRGDGQGVWQDRSGQARSLVP